MLRSLLLLQRQLVEGVLDTIQRAIAICQWLRGRDWNAKDMAHVATHRLHQCHEPLNRFSLYFSVPAKHIVKGEPMTCFMKKGDIMVYSLQSQEELSPHDANTREL